MRVAVYFSFLVLLSLTSCAVVMKKLYGIKKPKLETHASLVKNARKFGFDTTNMVTIGSKDWTEVFNGANGIPNAEIFDSKGEYIEYRQADTSCTAGLFEFIPSLAPTVQYNKTGKTTLQTQLEKYRNLEGELVSSNYLQAADFYLVIYWASYVGRLNKDHVKIWEDMARANPKAKIQVIKVNLDCQANWNDEQGKEIYTGLRKAF